MLSVIPSEARNPEPIGDDTARNLGIPRRLRGSE
jgi:hypothetical protein